MSAEEVDAIFDDPTLDYKEKCRRADALIDNILASAPRMNDIVGVNHPCELSGV